MRQISGILHDLLIILPLAKKISFTILNMKKDTIVQFVCFVTNLSGDEFAPQWEKFAAKLKSGKTESELQQQTSHTKNRFRYISKHEWHEQDIQFSFMKNKKTEHFPEHSVRVVQVGGYVPMQIKKKSASSDDVVKLIAFIGHNEYDIDFYTQLPQARNLNIYQAFYENCTYSYVLEFFVPENDVAELLLTLKQRTGVETGVYKECLVAQD
jgi:hypothetical protein